MSRTDSQLMEMLSACLQLWSLFHSLQVDSGKKRIYQSHKVVLSKQSLQLFSQMAYNSDILNRFNKSQYYCDEKIKNSYVEGIA